MHWNKVHTLLLIVGICIPLLIFRFSGRTSNDRFKLQDLSKILSILLVYESLFYIYHVFFGSQLDTAYFIFYEVLGVILPIAFVVSVLRYSPRSTLFLNLASFPQLDRNAVIYFLIFSIFTLNSVGAFLAVDVFPNKVKPDIDSIIFIKAIDTAPLLLMPFLLFFEFFSVVGEEFVFRYFAINALNQKLSKRTSIVISSLIWTMVHSHSGFGLFINGLLLGYLYSKTNSLVLCSILHLLFNVTVSSIPLYSFYKDVGAFTVAPYQYALALLTFQVVLFLVTKAIFNRIKGSDYTGANPENI